MRLKLTSAPLLRINLDSCNSTDKNLCEKWILINSGVTRIFFRGGHFSWFFSQREICFLPVEIFHFGTPKQIFVVLESEKQKYKKKKKI